MYQPFQLVHSACWSRRRWQRRLSIGSKGPHPRETKAEVRQELKHGLPKVGARSVSYIHTHTTVSVIQQEVVCGLVSSNPCKPYTVCTERTWQKQGGMSCVCVWLPDLNRYPIRCLAKGTPLSESLNRETPRATNQ